VTRLLLATALAAVCSAAAGAAAPPPPVLLAVGDVASCRSGWDERVADVVAAQPGAVLALLGDTVYERGTDEEFRDCYAPAWGRFRSRTRPAVGNHEYGTPGAAGYFRYFGAAAHPPRGYYGYDLGAWHVVVLNSNCAQVGGCHAGSPQERWLRADLSRHRSLCTLAYWHHPRFSSGLHGSDDTVDALWRALAAAGAELVLSGHDHHYERFAPLDREGRVARTGGLRQFVVGTGGRSLYPAFFAHPGSQVRTAGAFGVLRLTLRQRSYAWRFVGVAGEPFTDRGSAPCR
jgi:hypothetical protein